MNHPDVQAHDRLQVATDRLSASWLEQEVLPRYLPRCRWFAAKSRPLHRVWLQLRLPLPVSNAELWMVRTIFTDGGQQLYLMPVRFAASGKAPSQAVIASLPQGSLVDACYDAAFREFIFASCCDNRLLNFPEGSLQFLGNARLPANQNLARLQSRLLAAEQSNTSMLFDWPEAEMPGFFLKIYRRLHQQVNPEVEVTRFLTEQAGYAHVAAFAGTILWKPHAGRAITLAILQTQVAAQTDLWTHWHRLLDAAAPSGLPDTLPAALLQQAGLLALRTAELHRALASGGQGLFGPEPFDARYCHQLLQRSRRMMRAQWTLLRRQHHLLQQPERQWVQGLLQLRQNAETVLQAITELPLHSLRIRIHGDYHLGQVVFDGTDLIILDFEGEPDRSIRQRRVKHSPLKDVAGMLRSFHYLLCSRLLQANAGPESRERAWSVVPHLYRELARTFLCAYLQAAPAEFLTTAGADELNCLLRFHLFEKAIYELAYEQNSRPHWLTIPLMGALSLLQDADPTGLLSPNPGD